MSRIFVSKKTVINQGVAADERIERGLSLGQMADVLGVEGPHAEEIVMGFESGFRQIKGPTLRLYESMNRGRWSGGRLLGLPRWSVDGVEGGGPVIHHTEWPRFVGRAFTMELHPEQWQFKKAGMAAFVLDERTGYRQLVVSFLDHVPADFDPEDLVAEGVRYLESRLIKK